VTWRSPTRSACGNGRPPAVRPRASGAEDASLAERVVHRSHSRHVAAVTTLLPADKRGQANACRHARASTNSGLDRQRLLVSQIATSASAGPRDDRVWVHRQRRCSRPEKVGDGRDRNARQALAWHPARSSAPLADSRWDAGRALTRTIAAGTFPPERAPPRRRRYANPWLHEDRWMLSTCRPRPAVACPLAPRCQAPRMR
jgi:hypothetical protein